MERRGVKGREERRGGVKGGEERRGEWKRGEESVSPNLIGLGVVFLAE